MKSISEKAEKFISDCTRNCSNQYDFPEYFENGIKRLKEYQPWLTPDQALRAVEIARKEAIEQTVEWLLNNTHDYFDGYDEFAIFDVFKKQENIINDFKQAMKDESI